MLKMSYAHPEVLVDTEWVSKNPPNENRKIVEVDYDPENGYRKGHIKGASLIWWKRDINDPVARDIVNKEHFQELMAKNGIKPDTEVIMYGDFNNWFAAFSFWVDFLRPIRYQLKLRDVRNSFLTFISRPNSYLFVCPSLKSLKL